jgi:hydrogenase maturation protease
VTHRLTPPVLVVGVGNDLCGDDVAGWWVAEAVAGWGRPGVTVVRVRQLVPELAPAVVAAATVVLVDAAVGGSDTPSLMPASAEPGSAPLSHRTSPAELLALVRALGGRLPQAWTLAVPAESFEVGAAPSPRCQAGIEAAIRLMTAVLPGE